jgi:four helix bundle protein
MSNYKGFTELECYKNSKELRKSISLLAKKFPKDERFKLISQIIRSSRSITANIAEGYGRYTYTDTRHFFIIARGSVTETMEHLTTAFDEGYILESELNNELTKCELVFKLINGFISYLDRSKKEQRGKILIPKP